MYITKAFSLATKQGIKRYFENNLSGAVEGEARRVRGESPPSAIFNFFGGVKVEKFRFSDISRGFWPGRHLCAKFQT
jgi:hypothetical protein